MVDLDAADDAQWMDWTADYALRGRAYGHLSTDDLVTTWRNAMRACADHARDDFKFMSEEEPWILVDLTVEFVLRGREPPEDLIASELAAIESALAKRSDLPTVRKAWFASVIVSGKRGS